MLCECLTDIRWYARGDGRSSRRHAPRTARSASGVLLLAVLAAHLCAHFAEGAKFTFVLVSDFHYDPLYGRPGAAGDAGCDADTAPLKGKPGCDSPLTLVQSASNDIIANTPAQSALLFMGDWLRHHMPLNRTREGFTDVTNALARAANRGGGGGSIVPAPSMRGVTSLGNNDFLPDDYLDITAPKQPLIEQYAEMMANASLLSLSEAQTFRDAGYYYRDLAQPRMRVVVLNTLLYSPKVVPPISPDLNPDPLGQFAFLSRCLQEASTMDLPTVVLSHIPPTVSAYECVVGTCTVYMQEDYISRYAAIIKRYESVVVYQFYGHAHKLSLMADPLVGAGGMIVPAISPLFGNSPAYLVAEYDDERRVFGSFRLRYMSLDTGMWGTYSVKGQQTIDEMIGALGTADEIRSTVRKLGSDDHAWEAYLVLHAGGESRNMWGSASPTSVRQRHLCSMIAFTMTDFILCSGGSFKGAPASRTMSGGVIAVAVISFLIGVGGLVYAMVHFNQMKGVRMMSRISSSIDTIGGEIDPVDAMEMGRKRQ